MRPTTLVALLFLALSPLQNAKAQSGDYGNLTDRNMACTRLFLGTPADLGTLVACYYGFASGYMCEMAKEDLAENLSWEQIGACFRKPKEDAKK